MAQTLKFGNGNFATKAGSTLCYDDQNGNFKPIPMDFTRASTATRVNKQGLIEVVKSNVPRIDYTDTTNGVLLLEKAATNRMIQSENLSTGWTNISVSVETNSIISPDGTLNADKITQTNATSDRIQQQTLTTSSDVTISCFVKSTGVETRFRLGSATSSHIKITSNADGTMYIYEYVADNYFIENYGNGWYRVGFTFSASSSLYCQLYPDVRGLGGSIYVWGSQFEVNPYPTSYIPTTTTTVTRSAETASGAGNSEVFNDSQGVLFANIAANADDLTQRALGISDGTHSNRMSIVYNDGSSNALRMFVSNPSGTKSYITNSFNITQNNKISIKLNGTSLSFWVNGFEIHTDTLSSAFVNGTLDTFDFAFFGNNTPFYGKTKEIGYYDTILTDLELETLTSYKSWTSMVNELNLNIIYNG